PLLDQGGDDAARASLARSDDGPRRGPRKLAAAKHGLEDGTGLGRQLAEADLLLCPQQDARAQPVRLNQPLHECYLIDAGGEKEAREVRQRLLAQMSSAIEIVAPRQIAGGEVALVVLHVSGKPAGDRPDRSRVQGRG